MIRVNLLSKVPGEAPPRDWIPKEQRSALLGLGMLMVTAVGLGGWWWYFSSEHSAVDAKIATAESELVRLKEAAQLVEKASARKAELAERVSLIERLRSAKRGPVNLLETVSVSAPDGVWLIEIKQQGVMVQIDGRALSVTSITDFAGQLQNSGLFKHPVEILSTINETIEDHAVVKFSLKAEAAPTVATSPAAPTAPVGTATGTTSGVPGVPAPPPAPPAGTVASSGSGE